MHFPYSPSIFLIGVFFIWTEFLKEETALSSQFFSSNNFREFFNSALPQFLKYKDHVSRLIYSLSFLSFICTGEIRTVWKIQGKIKFLK